MRILLLLLIQAAVAAAAPDQFQHWYKQFRLQIEFVLNNNCSEQYHNYLNQTPGFDPEYQLWYDPTKGSALTAPLVSCMLSNLPENVKANMANAGVILGLLPTMLSMLGSNTVDTAILARVAGRPFLSLCLALGSPAVLPDRPFEYPNVKALLGADGVKKRIAIAKPGGRTWILISALEYIVALGAVANVATVCYQLGIRCICNYATEVTAQPLIWAFIIALIHIGGMIALSLRYRVIRHPVVELRNTRLNRFRRYLVREITPSLYATPVPDVDEIEESYLFLLFSWCVSTGAVVHILYGTMVLSSLLFISVQDALANAGRFLASVVCCRAVLAYELAGLRQARAGKMDIGEGAGVHELSCS
ncbi:hypothetical protein ANOM_001540 [Aspergillus nomiae NRRL 13137]|uniref:Uncharacterized protein n=1 Tax=Aspergillus nomiae NRRL (strain ATCC 15546 / NRRL 13137 / CBS 260.88 / M93) TaxID=1509407 RepID=A0A0L1JFN3_ASPN3|nr:uncharacterized protein ANOM_001540 [Aspergillus nomiae NRRL 13137]KNG90556.1 hypothetical protein ANOM_001540 [Aspergillus nomiae NRRL 13137]